jgi:acyl-CoA thioester hydrolase
MGDRAAPEISHRIDLRWRDIDMLGHLNQSVYHELLEEGRWVLFDPFIDPGAPFAWVLARVELDHLHEVRREDGYVEVRMRFGRLGGRSVTIEHEIVLPDGTVAAAGSSVMVAWDPELRGPRGLSEQERDRLRALVKAS